MLNPEIFSNLQRIWGAFSIDQINQDLFASYNNHQTKQYYSFYWTPTSSGVDAFKFNWGRTCYCYPPYKLMGKVISHARICGARMCLIIPYWVQAEWWNMITTDGHWFTTLASEIIESFLVHGTVSPLVLRVLQWTETLWRKIPLGTRWPFWWILGPHSTSP